MKRQVKWFVKNQKDMVQRICKIIGADAAWCDFHEIFRATPVEYEDTQLCVEQVERIIPSSLLVFDSKIKKNRVEVQWFFFFENFHKINFKYISKVVKKMGKTNMKIRLMENKRIICFAFRKDPDKILKYIKEVKHDHQRIYFGTGKYC